MENTNMKGKVLSREAAHYAHPKNPRYSTYEAKCAVFMKFGYAIYKTQTLEHWIGNLLLVCGVARRETSWLERTQFLDNHYRKTLGRLIHDLSRRAEVPKDLAEGIERARHIRNSLAHGFFRTRHGMLDNPQGCADLLQELDGYEGFLDDLVRRIQKIALNNGQEIGVSHEDALRMNHDLIDVAGRILIEMEQNKACNGDDK